MARHSSPRSRHALETRPTPTHRRAVTENGASRAVEVVAPHRRGGSVAAIAGGALSIVGAGAAGWVAMAHLPVLVDAVMEGDAAPEARTVTLLAVGTPVAEDTSTQAPPAPLDPAELVSSTQQFGITPAPAAPRSSSRPAVSPTPAPAPATQPAPSASSDGDDEDQSDDRGGSSARDSDDDQASSADRGSNDDARSEGSERESASGSDSSSDSGSSGDADSGNDSSSSDDSSSSNDSGSSNDSSSGNTDSGSSNDSSSSSDPDSPSGSSDSGGSSSSDSGSSNSGSSNSGSSASGSSESGSGSSSGTSTDARTSAGTADSTFATTATGGVAQSLPSELIDTKNWYLTLPTGKEGSPDLVEGATLARYHSQFFQLNQAKNGVVFTAGTGGATTSGSNFPRSELREMAGSEKASWDGRKGRHTMEIVEAITETPSNKPDVIAGQIHATTDDLMQIHLSGNKLRVRYDDNKFADLDPNYRLGTMFAVKIESAEGRVKVWYNGLQKADLPISSSTSYFKAGVYTNSNPSTGDKSGEGQVVIKSLTVRHT